MKRVWLPPDPSSPSLSEAAGVGGGRAAGPAGSLPAPSPATLQPWTLTLPWGCCYLEMAAPLQYLTIATPKQVSGARPSCAQLQAGTQGQ